MIFFCLFFSSFSSVQSLSHVQLFRTPWTAAHQASLSITNSQSLLKVISIEVVMPSNHLILSSTSPRTFNLSQHQGLFKWVVSSQQVAKELKFQLQHRPSNEYSAFISFRMDWGSPCSPKDSQEPSPIPQCKSINSLVLSFLYSPTLTAKLSASWASLMLEWKSIVSVIRGLGNRSCCR